MLSFEMNFTEIFTTYLTIGAPFGAYYFLKNRGRVSNAALFARSTGAVLLWFLFAARLLRRWVISSKVLMHRARWNFSLESKIERASQNILNIFAKVSNETGAPTYFEFRETLERFIGLTLASRQSSPNSLAAKHESEIFRIVGHESRALRLAERISHRKNYLRLQLHQSFARQDFLRVCQDLNELISTKSSEELKTWQAYQLEVTRLLDLLKDEKSVQAFWSLRETPLISPNETASSEKPGRDLWSPQPLRTINKTLSISVSPRGLTTKARD